MSSKVTGLVSGFDTQSIVESFMAIEKIPMDKLEYKKESADVKLQAYQAVNTYLNKFKLSMNTLASKSLWNSKAAVSTNEKAMTAKASEYAVNGAYSFKVAQLATSTQYMSKGFASKNSPLVKQTPGADGKTPPPEKLGSISLSTGKARVDNSAELESLNGGKGVYRGSVRITDASGTTSTVDLSSCTTMDDVVMKLNESEGAQVSAYLKEGRLVVEDASGGTKNPLKITNVGTGTTATDLGIVGAGETINGVSTMEGRNVYIMGNNTSLQELNDGLGVETGADNYVSLRISAGNGSYYPIDFDLNGCDTVGDLVKRLNDTLANVVASDAADPVGGMHSSELQGLSFSVSEDGTSFALNGAKAGLTYQFYDDNAWDSVRQTQPASQLGLTGMGAYTALENGEVITYDRVFGGVNSPMLKNLSGATGSGIGSSGDTSNIDNYVPTDFDLSTPLSALNEGKGLTYSSTLQFMVYEGGKYDENGKKNPGVMVDANQFLDPVKVGQLVKDGKTVNDLLDLINEELKTYSEGDGPGAAALVGLEVKKTTFEGKNVLAWTGAQAGYEYEVNGLMARDLGLTRLEGLGGTLGMQTGPIVDDDGNVTGWGVSQKDGESTEDFEKRESQYKAMQYLLNGSGDTSLIQAGGTFLDSDKATLGLLAANFSGIALEQPQYQKVDEETGDLVFDDEGNAVYDKDLWLADCEAVLNGEKYIDASGDLVDGKGPNSLDNILNGTFDIEMGGKTITVDWADVLGDCTEGGKSFSEVDVKSFLNTVNDAIATEAKAQGFTGDTPKIRVDSSGMGFSWAGGFDYTDTIVISGAGMDALGLERDTEGGLSLGTVVDDNLMAPTLPMVPGTSGLVTITDENAKDYFLSEANLGFGMDLESLSGKSIDVKFGEYDPDADPDPRPSISIQMDDVLDEIRRSSVAGTDDASKWSLQDYMNALNAVTKTELAAHNANSGEDPVSFEWGVVNGGLGLVKTDGFSQFTVGGDANDPGANGLSQSGINGSASGSVNASGKYAQVGVFNVPFFDKNPNGFDGIGTIDLSLGNGDVITLSTSGLTTESTLSDLLDKLNSELDSLADGSHPDSGKYDSKDLEAFANIRFTLNGSGTGIAIDNTSNKTLNIHDTKTQSGASKSVLAQELGLIKEGEESGKVEAYSFSNSGSLGRDYVSRATDLEEWIGKGAEKGGVRLTDSSGRSFSVDFSECETLGDVIDALNMNYKAGNLAIGAMLNETGDGIVLFEDWSVINTINGKDMRPPADKRVDIAVEDTMGGCVAQKLGFSGKGTTVNGQSVIDAKFTKTIDVMTTDTLEDVMYRISEAGYKAAIINDGTASNPYRLTVSANATGKENDFVIETDIDLFDFNQTQQGRDAKVLYGDPNSTASPIMLSSTTNSNSNAILGLSLEMKQVSDEWTTITVDTDKDKVVEEITNMAQAYNDLVGIISMLDGYDSETGEKGILFGDSTVRKMMDEIDAYFYLVYDPYSLGIGGTKDGEQATWTWADMGIKLTAAATDTDAYGQGSGWYSGMEVDTDKLESMVSSNWEVLSAMLYGERNAAAANAGNAASASASFNGGLEPGYDNVGSAINGDTSKSGWGLNNGIKASDTIANGSNSYSVIFNKPTTVTRMNIVFPDSSSSLKDYDIEYMDPVTGKWEKLRSINGNASDANYLSVTPPKEVAGMRIVASSTNDADDKFQLLDFQLFEEVGLASQLNQHVNAIADTREGFLATQTNEITANIRDINEQMTRLQNKLDSKEQSLWRKFNAMEQALAQLQNQSSYFSSMMGSTESK